MTLYRARTVFFAWLLLLAPLSVAASDLPTGDLNSKSRTASKAKAKATTTTTTTTATATAKAKATTTTTTTTATTTATATAATTKAKAKILRIISLAPSNTELVYSLNAGKQLVGVSDICDFPAEAKTKERVGNLSSIKMEKIAKLQPDLVLLVSGQESLANMLKKHGFQTLTLDNSSVENIGKNLLALGKVSGREAQSRRLASAFEKSIQDLKTLTKKDQHSPRIFICIWPQPLMSAGKSSFMSEGVTIAGGTNCTADLPQSYPRINPEKLLLLHPDIILVPQELSKEKFWTKAPWTSMMAVKENHVFVLPQHETDCLNRPTLRFVDALYWLSSKLHPDMQSEIDKWWSDTNRQLAN